MWGPSTIEDRNPAGEPHVWQKIEADLVGPPPTTTHVPEWDPNRNCDIPGGQGRGWPLIPGIEVAPPPNPPPSNFARDPYGPDWFENYDHTHEDALQLMGEDAGRIVAFGGAKQMIRPAVFLIDKSRREDSFGVSMTGFFLDEPRMFAALTSAAQRGVMITIIADLKTTVEKEQQWESLMALTNHSFGTNVWLASGFNLHEECKKANRKVRVPCDKNGIQHSKTQRAGTYLIVGSTNWTTSSTSKQEFGAVLHLGVEANAAFTGFIYGLARVSKLITNCVDDRTSVINKARTAFENRNSRERMGGNGRSAASSSGYVLRSTGSDGIEREYSEVEHTRTAAGSDGTTGTAVGGFSW